MSLLRSSALAALVLVFFPLHAAATLVTLTFDLAVEDTTLNDPLGHDGPYGFTESGARIDSFWAVDVGQATGHYRQGHMHTATEVAQPDEFAPFGYVVEKTHAWTGDLQGIVISLEDGGTFDLVSLDYDIKFLENLEDEYVQRLPWSFGADDPKFTTATSFDPAAADFESQWETHDAISTVSNSFGPGDWRTLEFDSTGLTNLTSIMISQTSAQANLDNIVINVHAPVVVPEPSAAALLGLGLIGLGRRKTSNRHALGGGATSTPSS